MTKVVVSSNNSLTVDKKGNTMTNKQTFIQAVKKASKVFVGTQVMAGDKCYIQAVKADILFMVKDYPADAEVNYTIQDSDSIGALVFID